ncbi:hypothetical protein RJ639_022379 [Escallonia herrerae]|uniref:Uncharacterized protein n=1 Tax=Escallonia herrerae TaxID=1293975 RepID=A0AA88V5T9_9ASTE|nr:hypothetical protein RJ639_022379 [Escallonia herrerae]
MSVLYPKLDEAFTKLGAPDPNFQDNVDQLETVGSKRKRPVAESEQKGNGSTETVGSKTEKAPARNNGKKTKENETVEGALFAQKGSCIVIVLGISVSAGAIPCSRFCQE